MALKKTFPAPTAAPISSVDSRADLAGLVVRSPAGVPRAGVFFRNSTALVTARASMGVDVAAFEAVLVRAGLPAFIANDGAVTVAVGAAPGANSVYKVVYVRQNEAAAPYSDGNDNPVFGFVESPAAASPSLAAALALVPAGGLALASILVPSTATTTLSGGVVVTQLYPYTATTGGMVPVRDKTERDAGSWVDGQLLWQIDNDFMWVWDGAGYDNLTPAEWPIVPDSTIGPLSFLGGSATVDATGLITCVAVTGSAATPFKIPGIFAADTEVIMEMVGEMTGLLQFQLMAGVTPNATAASYVSNFDQETSGSSVGAVPAGATGIIHNVGAPIEVDATVVFKRAALVDQTIIRGDTATPTSATAITVTRMTTRHNQVAAYNGLALVLGSAFSGTIRFRARRR